MTRNQEEDGRKLYQAWREVMDSEKTWLDLSSFDHILWCQLAKRVAQENAEFTGEDEE